MPDALAADGSGQSPELAIDNLFRRHSGELVALLARILGSDGLRLAEDVVSEAFVEALKRWPWDGVPDNPRAWITRVARNRAIDRLRRERRFDERRSAVEHEIERRLGRAERSPAGFRGEIQDDQLRLIFACCHPALSEESRVALVLSTAGGMSAREIARGFLVAEATVAQRLVRARARLRALDVPVEFPGPEELAERVAAVQASLYLMFNRGYAAFEDEELIRPELCLEAVRLAELLADHPVTEHPSCDALAALFLFQAARLPARLDAEGVVVVLAEQDRSVWDGALSRRGLERLRRSARGQSETRFHLEAEIASCHTLSPSHAEVPWEQILRCYDRLSRLAPSPVVELNRLVAVLEVHGLKRALELLGPLEREETLLVHPPFHVVRAEVLRRAGQTEAAKASFQRALDVAGNRPLRRFLEARLAGMT